MTWLVAYSIGLQQMNMFVYVPILKVRLALTPSEPLLFRIIVTIWEK